MKKNLILLTLMIFSLSLVRAQQPRGIDLEKYAFGIPANQLNFSNQSSFTFSFWVNIKDFDYSYEEINFIHIRNVYDEWMLCEQGFLWSYIALGDMEGDGELNDNLLSMYVRNGSGSKPYMFSGLEKFSFYPGTWNYVSLVYIYTTKPEIFLYINGVSVLKFTLTNPYNYLLNWKSEFVFMVGGNSYHKAPLNACIDKVQFYNKALTSDEVVASMTSPLLNDESLLGYWDFEDGCTTDIEGFMQADNGTIKATIYKILQQESGSYAGVSIGTEIQPFVFTEGVDPESVIQGVEESVTEETKTKAYISNGVLYIENADGINSVEVYNSLGTPLYRRGAGCEDSSLQIALPSTIKGVLFVKVNNEVVKVIN